MRRRTFEEMITYFNQTVSEMDIDRKYKMTLLGIVTALLQKHDEELAKNSPKVYSDSGELISRQAAISVIAKWMLEYGGEGEERERNALKQAAEEIKDLPPTQPEIIRCKDCKLHGTNGYRLNCAVFCCTMPDDGFCSCGERREDG